MDDQRRNRTLPGDHVMWVHLFVSVVTALFVYMRIVEAAGCTARCDFSAIDAARHAFWWTDLSIFIVAAGAYGYFRSRIRKSWIIPASGIALTLIAFLVANIALSIALGQL
ncbi:MAG: hypothetical protein K0R99_965 [Microbacterium sp.]|jgi:hypothetical protein|uniref:hypothetical protein n=1 Tax=Microbacterium sp. TaxID=51671 RepID=UPI0026357A88|nr:hypothetical protein [Microbacterium sp.]MDF2559519.1 hypothetical protein [Microbacterium sp.]